MRKHSRPPRTRDGRILTECIASLAILAVGVAVSLTLSRASILLADEARLMNELAATAGAQAERTTHDACGTNSSAGQLTAPRISYNWIDAVSPPAAQPILQRHVIATAQFTPLSGRDSTTFVVDAAGVCPW